MSSKVPAGERRISAAPGEKALRFGRAFQNDLLTAALSEANIAAFQAKRDVWYANYQLHHEKGVGYGYANTFNAQAKVGFQIRVFAEKGEPFDPDRTVYNKDYLLEILDRGKTSLDEMKAAGQL